MRRIALYAVLPVLVILAGLLGLTGTETGSRWLLQRLFSNPALPVSVETIQGSLLERIELTGVRYHGATETVALKHAVFAWRARALFWGTTLNIADLSIDGLTLNIRTAKDQQKSSLDWDAGLSVPLQFIIEQIVLTDVKLDIDNQVYRIEKLVVSAASEHNRIKIHSLAVNSREITATLQGQVGLDAGFPVSLQADWQVNAEGYGVWQGATTINGDLHSLFFDNRLSSPFKLVLSGELEHLPELPHIKAVGDWSRFRWPITGATPQVNSEQGHFELAGSLDDYRLAVNAQLSRHTMPEAVLTFNGKGGKTAATIEKLVLTSKTGLFELAGKVSWQDAPAFELSASGQDFNLGLVVPELPGKLSFSSYLKGSLAANALQLDADIKQLSGQLRGHPVNAGGKLQLNGDQLKVDGLHIASGLNRLKIDGTLALEQAQAQSKLNVAVDMPALETLWPNLGGNLQGQGTVQGDWEKPTVLFAAKGRRLYFGEYGAELLAVDVDYQQGGQKASQITLSADAVKIGALAITQASAGAVGTLAQHGVNADITTPRGGISLALSGRLNGQDWAGGLARLELDSREAGLWRLMPAHNSVAIRAGQTAAGFYAAFDTVCLVRQSAFLCAEGRYAASGDLAFKLNVSEFPLGLAQAYLPKQIDVTNGVINGDVDIQRQKNRYSGRYRFDMAPGNIFLQWQTAAAKTALGASSLTGRLYGDSLSADLDLALARQDYCRAKLELDIATQNLSGRVTASLADAALIEPLMPRQISGLKGKMQADVAVAGTVQKPLLSGAVDVAKAEADIGELGIELRDINLKASAAGENAERIQLEASAKSGAGTVNLDGFLLLQAQSGWPVELMLTGENFEVLRIPEAQIAVSPDLKIVYAGNKGKVSGQIDIPKAAVQLKQLPENAVKVSGDETIIGAPPHEREIPVSAAIDADIALELGKDVSFSGQGLQTKLSGRLKVTNARGVMFMQGNVDMNKASYKSYGQALSVRKGRFIFNGPADNPWLDVEAIRLSNNRKVTAILNVTGPLKSPQTRISSEPPLAEADALAYLVTGRPLNQVSKSESNMVASAALSYGARQASWIAEQLGIDEFDVQEGETLQDTLVSVGQYLTPEFYVGTKVGLFNKQAVLVFKRKLTSTVNVETQTGTSQRIKLNYERDTE